MSDKCPHCSKDIPSPFLREVVAFLMSLPDEQRVIFEKIFRLAIDMNYKMDELSKLRELKD